MKILLVNRLCHLGGVETWMVALASALRRRGHACELFFLSRGEMAEHMPADCVARFGTLADLLRLVRDERYDVVHVNCIDWKEGVFAVRALGVPVVATAHGWVEINWTSRYCDALVACSGWIAREQAFHADLPIHVIRNGVDAERFRPPARSGDGTRPIVLWVGRGTDRLKRLDFFAGIVPSLRAAGLRVWLLEPNGAAAVEEVLPGTAARLQPYVESWRGVTPDRMPEVYREVAASGGCVVSTSKREGLPLALLEAQACGCPAIGPDVWGVNECISPRHLGTLYPSDIADQDLARIVIETVADAPTWRARSEAARRLVEEQFTLERMADDYERLYASLPVRVPRTLGALKARHRLGPFPYWRMHALHRWPAARALYAQALSEPDPLVAGLVMRAAVRASPALLLDPVRGVSALRVLGRAAKVGDAGSRASGLRDDRQAPASAAGEPRASAQERRRAPKVSVVFAVYNGERYVREAMDSLLAQTWQDYEIVVIDDGSTDGTLSILRTYRDPRIRILRNARNLGLIASLNRGLREAEGEYVARIDADDPSYPERLAKQVDYLERNPDVVLVGTLARCIDDEGRPFCDGPDRRPTAHEDIFEQLLQKNTFIHSGVMYRREPVLALGGYDPTAHHAEDYALWLRLAERHRVANLPETLVDYRVHAQQVSRKNIRVQRRVADRLRHEAYLRRRAAGLLPPDAPSPLPSLRDRLEGRLRTLGGDYVYWIDLYRQMGREDLAQAMLWPALRAAPLNEFLRDQLLARYLTPAQSDALRWPLRRIRALLRSE